MRLVLLRWSSRKPWVSCLNYGRRESIQKIKALKESEVLEPMMVDGVKTVGKTATWTQTSEELLHGIRIAWKNSRKCIMRSHYKELEYVILECYLEAVF